MGNPAFLGYRLGRLKTYRTSQIYVYEASGTVVELREYLKTEQIKLKKSKTRRCHFTQFIQADVRIRVHGSKHLQHLRFAKDVVYISFYPLELKTLIKQLHQTSQKIGL